MKTYIWRTIDTEMIAVQADNLEQAIGYANLEIDKIKQYGLEEGVYFDDEDAESSIRDYRKMLKNNPIILEPFKCVVL